MGLTLKRDNPLEEYRALRKSLLEIWNVHPSRLRGKTLQEMRDYYNEVVDAYISKQLDKHKEEVTDEV